MPQGRKKQPFTGKQKKEQLKERRARSRSEARLSADDEADSGTMSGNRSRAQPQGRDQEEQRDLVLTAESIAKINAQPDSNNRRDANRYALHFFRESDQELSQRKKEATQPFVRIPPEGLEVDSSEFWPRGDLGLPKRPAWHYTMTTSQVDQNENKSFRQYLETIEQTYGSLSNLSHFELNLETWRQLWRVTEMADIVLLVADIRHPIFHFPPALYDMVTKEMKKDFVIVLNKADLVEAPLVLAWIHFFKKNYPQIHVVPFASYAGMKQKAGKGKRIGNLRMASDSCKRLYDVCHEIVKNNVDIKSWLEKINDESTSRAEGGGDSDEEETEPEVAVQETVKNDVTFYREERFKDGILTIGCVGHPNVGKSSVLNAIMGKKVVSVSRTPGHTKYFQTIFITSTVKLVDCPGLVFPSLIPKAMQVLMGCFPIAQLREPYSAVQHLSQRLDIIKILKLQHPDPDSTLPPDQQQWSAYDVCEGWAVKRGFRTAKANRPDVYRAANHLLRMALDGRTLCLAFYPPDYVANKEMWQNDEHVPDIEKLQGGNLHFDLEQTLQEFASDHELAGTGFTENPPAKSTSKSKRRETKRQAAAAAAAEAQSEEEEELPEQRSALPQVKNKFALLPDDE